MTLNPAILGVTTNNYLGKSQWADPYLTDCLMNSAFTTSDCLRRKSPRRPRGIGQPVEHQQSARQPDADENKPDGFMAAASAASS